MADNILLLERTEQYVRLLHQQLDSRLLDASLTPTLQGNSYILNCIVHNVSRDGWVSEGKIIDAALRVGVLLGMHIIPGTILAGGREASLFRPYQDVEVLDYWICEPSYRQDELCKDSESARMLVRMNPDVCWGWIPGHVLEVGKDVKVRLVRQLFREGGAAGYFASLPVNSWGLRIVESIE